jgi:hypothetical protein
MLRTGPLELPPTELVDDDAGRLTGGEALLGLIPQYLPRIRPGQPPGAVRTEETVPEQRESAGTPRGHAVRGPPHGREGDDQVPPRARREPLRVAMGCAEPDRHAERQMQQCPRPMAPAHADGARRRLPERLTLVEAPRHPAQRSPLLPSRIETEGAPAQADSVSSGVRITATSVRMDVDHSPSSVPRLVRRIVGPSAGPGGGRAGGLRSSRRRPRRGRGV